MALEVGEGKGGTAIWRLPDSKIVLPILLIDQTGAVLTSFNTAVTSLPATDIQLKYGTEDQAITITLAGLADAAKATSNEIDNSANLFQDALVQIKVKTNAAGTNASGVVRVFAVGVSDGTGGSYPDAANNELLPIGVFNANANATTFISPPFSVANAFGGKLPEFWKIVVKNDTGAALDGTEGNHDKYYQGVSTQNS